MSHLTDIDHHEDCDGFRVAHRPIARQHLERDGVVIHMECVEQDCDWRYPEVGMIKLADIKTHRGAHDHGEWVRCTGQCGEWE